MRPCWYAFQGVACILSPYGAFTEIPPALPGDVYLLFFFTVSGCCRMVELATARFCYFMCIITNFMR